VDLPLRKQLEYYKVVQLFLKNIGLFGVTYMELWSAIDTNTTNNNIKSFP